MRSLGTIEGASAPGGLPLTLFCAELAADYTAAGAHTRGTLARLADPPSACASSRSGARGRGGAGSIAEDLPARLRRGPGAAGPAPRRPARALEPVRRARQPALVTRRGPPLVIFVQGNLDDMYDSNPWTRRAPWFTRLALSSIREATRIVTPSEGLAEWVATRARRRPGLRHRHPQRRRTSRSSMRSGAGRNGCRRRLDAAPRAVLRQHGDVAGNRHDPGGARRPFVARATSS